MLNNVIVISGVKNTGCKFVKELIAKSQQMSVQPNNPYFTSLVMAYRTGKNCWENCMQSHFKKKEYLLSFNQLIINSYFDKISNYPIICDNSLLLYYADVKELIPNVKLISMIRDPRDVIASKDNNVDITPVLDEYVNVNAIFKKQTQYLGNSLLELNYDQLITNEEEVVKLEKFINIEIDRELLKEGKMGFHLFGLSKDEQFLIEKNRKDIEYYSGYKCFYEGKVEVDEYKELTKDEAIEKASFLYQNENTDELVELCEYYTEKYPEEFFFKKILGIIYEEQDEFEKAEKYLNEALSIMNDDKHLHNSLGLLFHKMNKLDEAEKCFEKVIELDPKSADPYNNISLVLRAKRQFDKAKEMSKKAMELDATFEEAKVNYEGAILSEITDKEHKVFCVGYNRTGSSSFETAMKILGFNVKGEIKKQEDWMADDASNHKVIKFMKIIAKEYNAFIHEPWCLFYKEMYETFPDSKFVLTIRDENQWVKSFYNYFKTFRDGWTPFLLKSYDLSDLSEKEEKEFFIEKYREHNKGVMEFFSDKPDKLLVMNVIEGDGWEKLCPFLNEEVPDIAFPWVNRGYYKEDIM